MTEFRTVTWFSSDPKVYTGYKFPYDNTGEPLFFNSLVTPTPAYIDIKSELWSEKTRTLLYNLTSDLGIKSYSPSVLNNDNAAIKKSQEHLIDLIKYYEGDRYHFYEAVTTPYKDKYGHSTCGFGERTTSSRTQETAYKRLTEQLKQYTGGVKKVLNTRIGAGTYEDLPSSIKEGLIDLCYNKGLPKISSNSKLMEAIENKDYSAIINNLSYLSSGSNGADKKEKDPGLYRRSLSRQILAARDLTGKERKEADEIIEKLYNEAKEIKGASQIDLDKIYEAYKNGRITKTPISSESLKHKVESGETYYSIAKKYCPDGVNVNNFAKEIEKLNHKAEVIHKDDLINIPYEFEGKISKGIMPTSPVKPKEQKAPKKAGSFGISDKTISYVVEEKYKGKGYWAIASDIYSKYTTPGFTIKELSDKITELNNGKEIVVGNTIKIPEIESVSVTVPAKVESAQSADSGISAENTEPQDEIPLFKRMISSMIYKSEVVGAEKNLQCLTFDYKIQKGDTLSGLAQKFGIDAKTLMITNSIEKPSLIIEGKTLKIPKIAYKVKSGDNLTSIAKKFGLTNSILRDMNNIDNPDKIKINQLIEIPGYMYTVKSGDNLTDIAKKAGIELSELRKINGLKSSLIRPEQKLVILFNNSDYNVSSDRKTVTVDGAGDKVEIIDMSTDASLKSRKYLREKRRINGKVVANREVFKPTNTSKSAPLRGKTIIVNAGHGYNESGGIDIGVEGRGGLPNEWLINYDNAMRLSDKLRAQGATVIYLQGKRGLITDELKKPGNKADLFISVHANSAKDTKDRTQFFIRKADYSDNTKSKKLAKIAEKNFDEWIPKNEKISAADRFYFKSKQDYAQVSVNDARTGLLKSARQKMPSLIWEVAYITTPKGQKRLKDDELMKDYANVMTKSIIEYFN